MLLGFSLKNVLSYKDEQIFSLYAQNSLVDLKEENCFTIREGKESVLKSAVFYGKNAGGKSNLFKALSFMQNIVLEFYHKGAKKIRPFVLDVQTQDQPSEFSIQMYIDGAIYTYSLAVKDSKVVYEKLEKLISRATLLFERHGMELDIKSSFKKAIKLKEFLKESIPFLSTTEQFNMEDSNKVVEWFKNCNIIDGENFPEIITLLIVK